MKKLIFAVVAALTLAVGLPSLTWAQTSMSRPLTSPVNRDLATVSQDTQLSGDMTINISVAPLTVSNNGFGLGKLSTPVNGAPFGMMPRISIPNPTSPGEALRLSRSWIGAHLGRFRQDYAGWLRSRGLSMGFYRYTQEIMIETEDGPKKKAVSFVATFDISGRPTYGNPKIVDPDPTIVEATYTPLRAAEGLPQNWQYPDAGMIRWRVLDKRYQPLTGWRLEQANGAFDLDPAASNAAASAACLIDRKHPGCSGPTDVRRLMDRSGSTMAIVNYIHTLEPVYEEGTGDEQVAKTAISVDERTWNCSTFRNKGSFGFVLSLMADQYVVQYDDGPLPHQLVQQYGGKGISPTEPFEKEVPISALGGRAPHDLIISPLPGESDLLSVSEPVISRSLIYLAPVTAVGGDGELNQATFSGDMAVRLISSTDSTRNYYIGTVGDNYWGTGVYDRAVRFNLASPETTERFHLTRAGFDDHLLVAVNGTLVYIGANGGNMLELAGAGVAETSCSSSGSGWTCRRAGAYVRPVSYIGETPFCAAGQMESSGAQGYGCYQIEFANYAYCRSRSWGSEGEERSYQCTNGCAPYWVQHLAGATGTGPGCLPWERATNWNIGTNIDLRPFLRSGQNEIFMRTIVAGGGEGWIQVETAMCGASMGLGRDFVPVPATGGAAGVRNRLTNQAR